MPTIAEVLELPCVRDGAPQVEAGASRLGRAVRWVHVVDQARVPEQLAGGELILTTGIAMPDNSLALARHARELADADVGALVIELGRRFRALPSSLCAAAEAHALPVVSLHREISFAALTEAVHNLIVEDQARQLRESGVVHAAFSSLGLQGATPQEIVESASAMTGCSVVYENVMHQPLAATFVRALPGVDEDAWETCSRQVGAAGREHWATTPVLARGVLVGRLVLLLESTPSPVDLLVAGRCASALALNHLVAQVADRGLDDRRGTLLTEICRGRIGSEEAMLRRAAGMGVPLQNRALVPVVLSRHRPTATDSPELQDDLMHVASDALQSWGRLALTGVIAANEVGILLPLGPDEREDVALDALAAELVNRPESSEGPRIRMAAGSTVRALSYVARSFEEARGLVRVAPECLVGRPTYLRLKGIGLDGVLRSLRADPRLQAYVERELGGLIDHDHRTGSDLVGALTTYLDRGRSVSAVAGALDCSRPTVYTKLDRVRELLAVDLDGDSAVSLHLATQALKVMRMSASA